MPTAHVVYTGIYGFFFVGLEDDHADTVWALAPDGRRDLHHPHFCWAIWNPRQKGDGTTLDQGDPLATKDPWRADAVEGLIEVENVGSPGVSLWQEEPYNRDNLVPLERSHPSGAVVKVKQAVVSAIPDGLTACKARIQHGSLDVTYVDRAFKWKFTHQGGPPRFLAQEVCHHFELGDDESLTLSLGSAKLVLESQQGEDVVVFLGNTPHGDIFPTGTANPGQEDRHVRLFNRLAVRPHSNPSSLIAIPVHLGQPDPRHDHRAIRGDLGDSTRVRQLRSRRVHGANCPPGTWEESG